jgi:2'-5' RNA ligase
VTAGGARPGSPRARLFLALDLPPGPRAELAAWRNRLVAGRDDLRPLAEETLHLTLAFLGYRPEKEIAAIAGAAFEAVRDLEPATLSAVGIRPLPPRSPRLFALDLEDRRGRAVALQAAASEALAAGRFYRPEKRPFWPHVTLARVKRGRRADPLVGPAPPAEPFEAGEITLYRSLLRPQGALYEPLERLSLGEA